MRFILLTIALLLSTLNANAYQYTDNSEEILCEDYIVRFVDCYVNNNNALMVVLSDGSKWIIQTAERDIQKIKNEILDNWLIGDDIRIDHKEGKKKIVLMNTRSPLSYQAKLAKTASLPSKYYIQNMDGSGYAMLLDNQQLCIFGYLGAMDTQHWNPGDAVLINKSHFKAKEDFLIIHVATGNAIWGSLVNWKSVD